MNHNNTYITIVRAENGWRVSVGDGIAGRDYVFNDPDALVKHIRTMLMDIETPQQVHERQQNLKP